MDHIGRHCNTKDALPTCQCIIVTEPWLCESDSDHNVHLYIEKIFTLTERYVPKAGPLRAPNLLVRILSNLLKLNSLKGIKIQKGFPLNHIYDLEPLAYD